MNYLDTIQKAFNDAGLDDWEVTPRNSQPRLFMVIHKDRNFDSIRYCIDGHDNKRLATSVVPFRVEEFRFNGKSTWEAITESEDFEEAVRALITIILTRS